MDFFLKKTPLGDSSSAEPSRKTPLGVPSSAEPSRKTPLGVPMHSTKECWPGGPKEYYYSYLKYKFFTDFWACFEAILGLFWTLGANPGVPWRSKADPYLDRHKSWVKMATKIAINQLFARSPASATILAGFASFCYADSCRRFVKLLFL